MSKTSFYYQDWDRDFWKPSLDIETGIETFDNLVLISRLVLRLLELQSWYRDWYQHLKKMQSWYRDWYWDFQGSSLDIETGIETFRFGVLILRRVSRLSGVQSCKWGTIPCKQIYWCLHTQSGNKLIN